MPIGVILTIDLFGAVPAFKGEGLLIGVVVGLVLTLLGIAATILAFVIWGNNSFGNLEPESIMKITIPATTLIAIGIELIFASFFLGILEIEIKK